MVNNKKCLLNKHPNEAMSHLTQDSTPTAGAYQVLSWIIFLGTGPQNVTVQYKAWQHTTQWPQKAFCSSTGCSNQIQWNTLFEPMSTDCASEAGNTMAHTSWRGSRPVCCIGVSKTSSELIIHLYPFILLVFQWQTLILSNEYELIIHLYIQ